MNDFLKVVAAVIAATASVSAIAVVVDQFTLRSRLRKTEAWAVGLATSETGDNRKAKLTEVRLDATARVVGSIAVPLRHFAFPVAWVVSSPCVLALAVYDDPTWQVGAVAVVALACISILLTARQGIRLYMERARVTGEYRRDEQVVHPNSVLLHSLRGGDWIELLVASFLAIGACTLAIGVGLAFARGGDAPGWPLTLGLIGLILVRSSLVFVWERGLKISGGTSLNARWRPT